MLNRTTTVRINDIWWGWCKRLAAQADRETPDLIRDLIFLMIMDDELGDALCQRLKTDQISYRN